MLASGPPGLTEAVGVAAGPAGAVVGAGAAVVAGALAGAGAAVVAAALGAAATADEVGLAEALVEVVGAGLDDPQALTRIVPAMTAAPASQRPRADLITLFGCMR